jgi:DNA-binding XRE family transcriptional regulator
MAKLLHTSFEVSDALRTIGNNIRTARTRRKMQKEELAQRCGITRKTLYSIEKGEPGSSMGNLFTVLWVLGLLDSAKTIADPDNDEHGKILEAAKRQTRIRKTTSSDNDF